MRPILLSGLLLLAGCTHTRFVDDDEGYERLSVLSTEERATVVFHDGRKVSARGIHVSPDYASWFDPQTKEILRIPTREIESIRLVSRNQGALLGLGTGVVIGATFGGLLGRGQNDAWCSPSESCSSDLTVEQSLKNGILFGAVGGLVGFVSGAVVGDREVYHLGPPEGTAAPGPSTER